MLLSIAYYRIFGLPAIAYLGILTFLFYAWL